MPRIRPTGSQSGKLVALGFGEGFEARGGDGAQQTSRTPGAPFGLGGRVRYARGARVTGRHGPHGWRNRA